MVMPGWASPDGGRAVAGPPQCCCNSVSVCRSCHESDTEAAVAVVRWAVAAWAVFALACPHRERSGRKSHACRLAAAEPTPADHSRRRLCHGAVRADQRLRQLLRPHGPDAHPADGFRRFLGAGDQRLPDLPARRRDGRRGLDADPGAAARPGGGAAAYPHRAPVLDRRRRAGCDHGDHSQHHAQSRPRSLVLRAYAGDR